MSIAELFYAKQASRAHALFPRRRKRPPRPRNLPPKLRKVFIEPLEPRILLSADLMLDLAALVPDVNPNVTLRLDPTTQALELIDNNNSGNVLDSKALADTDSVQITGSDKDDTLTIDFSFGGAFGSTPVTFDAGSETSGDSLRIIGDDTGSGWYAPLPLASQRQPCRS